MKNNRSQHRSVFSERLKRARTEAGFYSQQRMAIELGVSGETYRRWEAGVCKPQLDRFLNICQITKKDPFWFLP
ncbi:MAG: helix-turn-helix transcriptional regulator [Prochlorotrichaceae cyanobacterium]|jgi:DNA-binding XRE family transcriptional regulator